MGKWLAVYRNRKKRQEDERWACTGCASILDQSHNETPKDGICTCEKCQGKTSSDGYRQHFDEIDWSVWKSPFEWQKGKGGHKVGRSR